LGICGVHNAPEIGYAFCPEIWGKGFATEAVQGLIKAYWDAFPHGHPRIKGEDEDYLEGRTHRWNAASEQVLRKNGFEFWEGSEAEPKGDANGEEPGKEISNAWRLWKLGCVRNQVDSKEVTVAKAHDQ